MWPIRAQNNFMINRKKVLAIIPARGGSKGLPGKNIRLVCGKPLIAWSIEQARACSEIDSVIVSTDSMEIADVAKSFGADVPFLRPEHLSGDTASSIDVVLHTIDYMAEHGSEYDLVVLLEPTSPLREASDISGAISHLLQTSGAESVVGVSQVESLHPSFLYKMKNGMLSPYLGEQPNNVRRQDIEDLYFLEGSVYVSYTDALIARKSFYHEATAPWIVPRYKSFEVDELVDLIAVEAIINARLDGKVL